MKKIMFVQQGTQFVFPPKDEEPRKLYTVIQVKDNKVFCSDGSIFTIETIIKSDIAIVGDNITFRG